MANESSGGRAGTWASVLAKMDTMSPEAFREYVIERIALYNRLMTLPETEESRTNGE